MASEAATRALARLADLWARERRTTHEQFAETRRGVPFGERVARGVALADLAIDDTGVAPGRRLVLWLTSRKPGGIERSRIGPGDPVRLWWDDPEGEDAVRGTVSRRRHDRLAVVVDEDLPDRYWDEGFRLDTDDPQATFDRGERALRRWRDASGDDPRARLVEVLLAGAEPRRREVDEPTWHDEALNEPQREAVRHALGAADVALIHGPPGTGKTRTLVEVVRQAVARGETVLASAASNTAVDNLTERLAAAGVEVLRLGHPARVAPSVHARTLDAQLEATDAWKLARRWTAEARDVRRRARARAARGRLSRAEERDMRREANRLERDARLQLEGASRALIDRAAVICATAAGADSRRLGPRRFDLVVLDEATQATDPIALVALGRGDRLVLAGDPCQLPPTVIDVAAAREGLGRTIFERLADREEADVLRQLVVQHRMHETLMAFPSASMYGGTLVAAPDVAGHVLADLPGVAPDPERPVPLVLVDTAGRGWDEVRGTDDPSTANPGHAGRTAAEARAVIARGVSPADVGVIAPYDAQVRALRELLAPEVHAGLEVSSIDGFQGREKEAIVLDLVRSNEDAAVGFLSDVRRMNVALTRARRLLVVVADSATIGAHPYYAAFLEAAEQAGGWTSAWVEPPGY